MGQDVIQTSKIKILSAEEGYDSLEVLFCFFAFPGTPTLSEKPVKSLVKIFDSCLRDTASIRINCQLERWMEDVDKTRLPGKFKAWMCQHGILARILWPLILYEFLISTISELERRVSYQRRWLVDQAKSQLRYGVLVGAVARGRAGLGTFQGPCFDKEWRQLVQSE